jgi:hypothetical protein
MVEGKITQSFCYWGGVAPSPEMLKQLETPRPYAHLVLFVKEGTANKEKTPVYLKFETDDSGHFQIQLPADKSWMILEEWQSKPLEYPSELNYVKIDYDCFQARYASALLQIKTTNQNIHLAPINIPHPCPTNVPCIQYFGPTPP